MGNRRSVEIMRCLSQAFGSASAWGAFDALATPVPTACGDFLFLTAKKRKQKMPLSNAEGLATAQIAFVIGRHALACKVGCKREVGCEMALRAVRDGFV